MYPNVEVTGCKHAIALAALVPEFQSEVSGNAPLGSGRAK